MPVQRTGCSRQGPEKVLEEIKRKQHPRLTSHRMEIMLAILMENNLISLEESRLKSRGKAELPLFPWLRVRNEQSTWP